jgi:putative flavoprotein involved in K+ transport
VKDVTTRVQTLIIGAGQAGLAMSRLLTELDHEHVVLERGRIAERWRSERWESFRLLSPNWQTRLPGYSYRGPDPHGFMAGDEVVRFFDDYARSFRPDVHTGVSVTSAVPDGAEWRVRTRDGRTYCARNLVVATGYYDRPAIPAGLSATGMGDVHQVHTASYRSPEHLPSGPALVVGAGPSGQQVADELAASGRDVHLAVSRHRPLPRSYRGADIYAWFDRMGVLHRTVDSLPPGTDPTSAPSVVLSGDREDMNVHRLAANGVSVVGRLTGVSGGRLRFADDLEQRVAEADAHAARARQVVDRYVEEHGLDAPAGSAGPAGTPAWARRARRSLPLRDVSTVVWATGYARDYSWLPPRVFDAQGRPRHRRGVSPAPGLFFMGLPWQSRRNSSFIDGVAGDAAYLAGRIAGRHPTLADLAA